MEKMKIVAIPDVPKLNWTLKALKINILFKEISRYNPESVAAFLKEPGNCGYLL